jgi:hypothetical protein
MEIQRLEVRHCKTFCGMPKEAAEKFALQAAAALSG